MKHKKSKLHAILLRYLRGRFNTRITSVIIDRESIVPVRQMSWSAATGKGSTYKKSTCEVMVNPLMLEWSDIQYGERMSLSKGSAEQVIEWVRGQPDGPLLVPGEDLPELPPDPGILYGALKAIAEGECWIENITSWSATREVAQDYAKAALSEYLKKNLWTTKRNRLKSKRDQNKHGQHTTRTGNQAYQEQDSWQSLVRES